MPLDTYETGTIDVVQDSTTVIGEGSVWTGLTARPGDLLISGRYMMLIDSVTDAEELELVHGWPGPTAIEQPYQIVYPPRWNEDPTVRTQDYVRRLLASIATPTVIYAVTSTLVPDPSLGDEGQYALKTNTGAWKLWLKAGGVWVDQGTPVGSNWKGLWSSATIYAINDTVRFGNSSYISLTAGNLNQQPDTNPDDWDLTGAGGSDASPGGLGLRFRFDSSIVDADPGAGDLRLSNATQNISTQVFLSTTDLGGAAVAALLDTVDQSTSTTKALARIFKEFDPTKFIDVQIAARTTAIGYRKFTFTVVNSSAASPFTSDDSLVFSWIPKGDKGDIGTPGGAGEQGIQGQRGAPGGAVAIQYTVDGLSTQNSDPTTGKMRFASIPQDTSIVIRLSTTSALGSSVASLIADLATASTSAIKATGRLYVITDPSKYFTFSISSVSAQTDYYNVTIIPKSSSAPNPFADGDSIVATWDPKGDKGDAATIAVGSTTTGNPGTDAAVVNVGTSSAGIFNFTIPEGDAGAPFSPQYVVANLAGRSVYDAGPVFDVDGRRLSVLVTTDSSNSNLPTLYFLLSVGPAVWSNGITFQSSSAAAGISYDPVDSGYAAVNVQDAIDEAAFNIADVTDPVAAAIIFGG